jgi:hypothetical protein
MKWKVISDHEPEEVLQDDEAWKLKPGIKGRLFSRHEFLIGLGLLIAADEFSQNGKELFQKTDQKYLDVDEKENWMSMVSHPGFNQYMSYSHFKEFRRFLPEIWMN